MTNHMTAEQNDARFDIIWKQGYWRVTKDGLPIERFTGINKAKRELHKVRRMAYHRPNKYFNNGKSTTEVRGLEPQEQRTI